MDRVRKGMRKCGVGGEKVDLAHLHLWLGYRLDSHFGIMTGKVQDEWMNTLMWYVYPQLRIQRGKLTIKILGNMWF